MWDVKVADNENENHPDAECRGRRNGEVTIRVAMEVAFGRLRNLHKTLIRSPSTKNLFSLLNHMGRGKVGELAHHRVH